MVVSGRVRALMARWRRRLVALLTAAAFLCGNTPAALALALRPADTAEASAPTAEPASCPDCCPCEQDEHPSHPCPCPDEEETPPAPHGHCPCCPFGEPSCPDDCCCALAQAPCCLSYAP